MNATPTDPLFKVPASQELREALRTAVSVLEERRACGYKRDDQEALANAQGELATLQLRLLNTLNRNRNRALPVIDAPQMALDKST
jgi:predicted component of type VI protein secretion system